MTDDEVKKLYGQVMLHLKRGGYRKIPAKLRAAIERNVCNACEKPRREWYMLRTDLWRIVNPVVHGHLCMDCLKQRFIERVGRLPRSRDFGEKPTDEWGDRLNISNRDPDGS